MGRYAVDRIRTRTTQISSGSTTAVDIVHAHGIRRVHASDSIAPFDPEPFVEAQYADLDWIKIEANRARAYRELKQRYMLDNIEDVRYNIYTMPKPPKKYTATVDPSTESITVKEIITDKKQIVADAGFTDVTRKNWLHNIDGRLQFSQAI